jgi:hypothetical protein
VRTLLALVVLLLGGCTGGQANEQARLSGIVRIGPTPGPCVVDTPCSRPARGVELVFSRRGHDGVRTTSDERGRYAVTVEPGRYQILAANYPAPATLDPATVTVVADTRLNLSIDSGVRGPSSKPS